jgi:hypothetical protein
MKKHNLRQIDEPQVLVERKDNSWEDQCAGKRRHRKYVTALGWKEKSERMEHGSKFMIYKCGYCHGFHIAHVEPSAKREEKKKKEFYGGV